MKRDSKRVKRILKIFLVVVVLVAITFGFSYCSCATRVVHSVSMDTGHFKTSYEATGFEIIKQEEKIIIQFDSFEGTLVLQMRKKSKGESVLKVEMNDFEGHINMHAEKRGLFIKPWVRDKTSSRPTSSLSYSGSGRYEFIDKYVIESGAKVIIVLKTPKLRSGGEIIKNVLKNGEITISFVEPQ